MKNKVKKKYFTSFDGAQIYYHATRGSKDKWIIFLHGLGGDLTAWSNERKYFDEAGYSTVALDLRGHGLSSRSSDAAFYSLDNFAKDVIYLCLVENIRDGVVVGHCFGGMVSIYLGAMNPKFQKGLVLVDTSYKPPFFGGNFVEETFLKYMLEFFEQLPDFKTQGHADFSKFFGTADIDLKRLLSDVLHTSLHSYLLICENMVHYNAEALLKKIMVPSLVVDGTLDSIFPPEVAKNLKDRLKRSELDLIEGGNHILVLNNPKDLEKSIGGFLSKINFSL